MTRHSETVIAKFEKEELEQLVSALRYLADGWEQATSDTEISQQHARTLRSLIRQIKALKAGASKDRIREAVRTARQEALEEAGA